MDRKIIKYLLIFIFICSKSIAIEVKGSFIQDSFIVGKTSPENKIKIDKKEIRISNKGYFVFGIDRDRDFDVTILITNNSKTETVVKKVYKRKYKIQRIDGLPENKVTPPKEVYDRIKSENNKIGEARAINSNLVFFKEQFIMPVNGIITGVYGSQRILNGKPKWTQYGIDIAAKKGTHIKS